MIVVLGDFMRDIDLHFETVRQSPEGQWPVVRAVGMQERPGGAGAVVSMVRGLGVKVVGLCDVNKPQCVKRRHFVNGKQLFREDQDHAIAISSESACNLIDQIPNGALVLVADYGKGIVTDALWSYLVAGHSHIIVDPARTRSLDFYRGAMAIVPNRNEAGVTSLSEAITRCHELRQHFARVCVKLDRDGMIFSSREGGGHIPSKCSNLVDVCGAGDMVLAALGVGLLRGMSWKHACEFANALASRKCSQHGATPVTGVATPAPAQIC